MSFIMNGYCSLALPAALLVLASSGCRKQAPPESEGAEAVTVVSASEWRYSDWFNGELRSGMSLAEVEALLGKDYEREDEEASFSIDYVYDDGTKEVPNGAVVGISLSFEKDLLDGWICSVQREL